MYIHIYANMSLCVYMYLYVYERICNIIGKTDLRLLLPLSIPMPLFQRAGSFLIVISFKHSTKAKPIKCFLFLFPQNK